MDNQPTSTLKKKAGSRWPRRLLFFFAAVILLITALAIFLRLYGYDLAKNWLESPAGPRVAGKELGKAIKVYGTFAPMKLDGWTILTDSFTSKGWPGEVIGELDAYDVRAKFDLSAVTHRAWRFSEIQLDHATIRLLKPDDAIKLHPEKKPPPWYAIFLPNHFECGPIICPKTELLFSFQGVDAGIHDAHVQADLIGKNLKYHVTSGVLEFPYLQPLQIQLLDLFVTRDAITIDTAQLVGLGPNDPSRITLSGRIGQHADKSIDATLAMNEISIEKILPENLRPLIRGNVSGNIVWHRNTAGDDITSEGDLSLTHAGIDNLSVFKELKDLHNNPDLQDFTFDQASCHYKLAGGKLALELKAQVTGKFNLSGWIVYDVKTKETDLDLVFDQLPLKVWMPPEFKPRYSGVAQATLKWHGQLDTKKDSVATVTLNMDGTHISNPVLLRKFLGSKGFRSPDEIQIDKAQFTFVYQNEVFNLAGANLVAPGLISAQLSGSLAPGNDLKAEMDWQGLVLGNFLPEKYVPYLSGALNGHVSLAVKKWQFGDGTYGGSLHLLDGRLSYTSPQSLLARFLGQRPLLVLPLSRTDLSWTWDQGAMTAKDIDIRGGNDLGVKGNIAIGDSSALSGVLWIGAKPQYLTWLPDAENTVFNHKEDGLVWARVKLSGTLKKPGQDFTGQIVSQLVKHPAALVALGAKAVSWYVGNIFGEAKEWQRPVQKDVVVSGATPNRNH